MKCRAMDELSGGRGVILATGTPGSNAMTDGYTVMRNSHDRTIKQRNVTHV